MAPLYVTDYLDIKNRFNMPPTAEPTSEVAEILSDRFQIVETIPNLGCCNNQYCDEPAVFLLPDEWNDEIPFCAEHAEWFLDDLDTEEEEEEMERREINPLWKRKGKVYNYNEGMRMLKFLRMIGSL